MKREGGVSTIPCKINGLSLNFIFDTGASDVSLSLTEASFMLKNGYLSEDDIKGTANYLDANGNLSEGITINLKEVDVGGLKLRNISATVVKNLKAPLLLGQSALRKLGKIEFDLEENTITINPLKSSEVSLNTSINLPLNIDSIAAIVDTIGFESEVDEVPLDKQYFEKGQEFYYNGEYEDALEYFNLAIGYNKSNKEYYVQRGLAKDMLNNWNEAIEDYSLAIKFDPKHSYAYAYRAESLSRIGDTVAALNDLRLALQYDPKNGYAYRERGLINYNRGKYSSAISDYNIALKYDPKSCYTYRLRGLAKYDSKKFNSAKLDFDSAIIFCEKVALSWMMRGATKIELKDLMGALSDLEYSLELDPELGEAYMYKASIAEKNKELEEAIELLEKAVELDSENHWGSIKLSLLKHELENRVWIPILSTSDDNGDEWLMKSEVESNQYGIVRIWLKQTQKKYSNKKNGKSVIYSNVETLYLTALDCKEKKLQFEYMSIYDSNGKVILSEQYEETTWKIAPPGSIGEALIRKVCERYN